MEKIKEQLWYYTFDWSMIWVCVAAVLVHILYLEINKKPTSAKLTIKHYLFYALSSLVVLAFISEVANWVLSNYTSASIDVKDGVSHFLAALSGLGGGYITSNLINRIQKKSK
ncbi:hypothetical protein [uncultured Wocania sp.]|uniref:hypothetical protein n=1 Tax=uncultured Wocania sp. TaxID=2834404 RepID=UPI0030FAE8B2